MLQQLTNLELLSIPAKGIEKLDFLQQMPKLRSLDLRSNPIQDYGPIAKIGNLESLYISADHLDDISFVQPLTNLKYLGVGQGRIHDLQPLAGLTQLELLDLSGNQIEDIAPLSSFQQLRMLFLRDNPILDVSVLGGLEKLEHLDLYNTRITSLRGLENLMNLSYVDISYNVVPVDSEPGVAALKERVLSAGGSFYYQAYNPIPDIVLYLYGNKVYAGGEYTELSAAAFLHESRTMVPIRFISEYLGAKVDWNQADKTITVEGMDKIIKLTVGSSEAEINGESVQLDASPQVRSGTTFVPLRFLSEQFGTRVDFYHMYKSIGLTKK